MRLPYDPEDPPAEPPAGADKLSWALAHQVHRDHQPDQDGACSAHSCRSAFALWPCAASRLAAAGFLGSLGAWSTPWRT